MIFLMQHDIVIIGTGQFLNKYINWYKLVCIYNFFFFFTYINEIMVCFLFRGKKTLEKR